MAIICKYILIVHHGIQSIITCIAYKGGATKGEFLYTIGQESSCKLVSSNLYRLLIANGLVWRLAYGIHTDTITGRLPSTDNDFTVKDTSVINSGNMKYSNTLNMGGPFILQFSLFPGFVLPN